jgi:hypothetical protein
MLKHVNKKAGIAKGKDPEEIEKVIEDINRKTSNDRFIGDKKSTRNQSGLLRNEIGRRLFLNRINTEQVSEENKRLGLYTNQSNQSYE